MERGEWRDKRRKEKSRAEKRKQEEIRGEERREEKRSGDASANKKLQKKIAVIELAYYVF